jgi:very-short-patch-repair endonuclease
MGTQGDDGAESPWQSLTRLLFVQNGFPRPQEQIPVHDEYGVLIAIIDVGWREYLVGVDFEGAHHWTNAGQRHWDAERFTRLPELGWHDFRVTSRMVLKGQRLILNRVGAALIARGCPKTW